MSLQYRVIAQDSREDVVAAATSAFDFWLREKKGLTIDLSISGRRTEAPGIEINVAGASSAGLQVRRMSLYEESANSGRWATILTVIATDDESWVWVDLEWVSGDPWGNPPVVKPPALIQYLLIDESVHIGPVKLPPAHYRVDSDTQAVGLVAVLTDPGRVSPVVVLSFDPHASAIEQSARAKRLAREVAGLAPVYLLSEVATDSVDSRLAAGLLVYGGAARTYLPGLDRPGPAMKRHRVLGSKWFHEDIGKAAEIVASPLRLRALSARPPSIYRERGRELLQSLIFSANDDLLLSDAIAAEQAAERAEATATQLRDDLEWQVLEHDETLSELEGAIARVRFLESELAKVNAHLVGVPTPEEFEEVEIATFEAVLREARAGLDCVEIGDTDDEAEVLDGYVQASAWAKKTWRALLAMESYAEAKKRGWSGDFNTWCIEPETPASISVPSKWVALTESDSVDNNPKYKSARIFPVPLKAHANGRIYMCAHIKIVEGGRPAPRLHFFDDTSGPTKKIYVGYVGPHLVNGQTN